MKVLVAYASKRRARAIGELIADCAGRECSEDDVRQFLAGVGVAGPDT